MSAPLLFVILDGVPFSQALTLWERGQLGRLARPRPMVAPFPSLTHISVPALVHPATDGRRPPGYEPRWFHPESQEVRGGVSTPEGADVIDLFRGTPQSSLGQVAEYFLSSHVAYHEVRWYARAVGATGAAWLGWVSATDAVGHLEGEQHMLLAAADVAATVQQVADRVERETGTAPVTVLASDHGMRFGRLKHLDAMALERALGRAQVGRAVLVPHGDVACGAVHCARGDAGAVAEVVSTQRGVDLAVARVGEHEALVVGAAGRARVQWRDGQTRTEGLDGDPLQLGPLLGTWIADRELLERTWSDRYPWSAARIRDGLTDRWVRYPAPVLFSMQDGWTYGPPLTHLAAMFSGGQVGTHGALSRDQTLGFAASTDDAAWPDGPLIPSEVLAPWADRLVEGP